ncbi:putative ubiquitin c-terminal hydrolase [Phaeomoniella chlamydospora]|uniref:Putative ubiquitin c-terminal hydrolase n=1 Tax=Phaeomoniella chlamydospora TaxID=158046 RepID=A0A0G2E590_PHACM|nr:putative ubiquitin c-terminal hydrolase [Phaeomoniella chlamydospora]
MSQSDESGEASISMMETSRSRDETLDDRDSEQERKRPKLNHGDALPADEAFAEVGLSPDVPSPHAKFDTTPSTPANTSPRQLSSKVTINTRPSSSANASSHDQPDVTQTSPTIMAEVVSDHSGSQVGTAIEPVSLSPDSSRSPEIEIAEPEDIDHPSDFTKWTSISELQSGKDSSHILDATYVFATFPRAHLAPKHKTETIVAEIANHVHSSKIDIENPISSVTRWMEGFLDDCREIPTDIIVDDMEFWLHIPMIVEAFLRRKIELPTNVHEQLVDHFFFSFLRLTTLFIEFDNRILVAALGTTELPPLLSPQYLFRANTIFQYRGVPLYSVLETKHGIDSLGLVTQMAFRLVEIPCNIAQKMQDVIRSIFSDLQKKPAMGSLLIDFLRMIHNIILLLHDRAAPHIAGHLDASRLVDIDKACFEFCRVVDNTFQQSISKQWGWVSIDSSTEILNTLASCYQCLALNDPSLVAVLMVDSPENGTSAMNQLADIALYDWKFRVYWKAIKTGRMELRAQGIELLQMELVTVYHRFIRREASVDSPIVHHMVNLLRQHRVLQYLVSAESHPQLISRSGNIIAFLAVSGAYTEEDTDILWNFILENRDSRMVSELFNAMTALIENMDAASFGYLFTKFFDFPIGRIDGRALELCGQLLRVLNQRWDSHKQYVPDILQIRLFVHLLRTESASEDVAPEARASLRKWAQQRLNDLSDVAVSDLGMSEVWKQCVSSIEQMDGTSHGSIIAIQSLTRRDPAIVLRQLSEQFNYPALLVRALTRNAGCKAADISVEASDQSHFVACMGALADVIRFVPDTLTSSFAEMLWQNIFASPHTAEKARDFAWDTLSYITENDPSENKFIEMWTNDFFQRLKANDHRPSAFRYAQAFLRYRIRREKDVAQTPTYFLTFPGIDLLWRFALSSPANTVEGDAINALISFYLDSKVVLRCPRETIEAIHIALVDQCIAQIIDAATKLQPSGDPTATSISAETNIDSHFTETPMEELYFSRSLLFLRQFLNAIKINPRYSPPLRTLPARSSNITIKGREISIKYQAFNGSDNSEIRDVKIGDLNTADDLVQILREVTRMSKFICLHHGQYLNLFDEHVTLKDLGFGTFNGLLILKRSGMGSEGLDEGRRNSTTHIDCEISKNFDQLYDLLELDNHLAVEIFNFLQVFPIQQKVRDLIRDREVTASYLLPLSRPYKLLYSANAFYSDLQNESFSSVPDLEFLQHSMPTLLSTCKEHILHSGIGDLDYLVMASLTDCILAALTVKVPPSVSSQFELDKNVLGQYILKALQTDHNDRQIKLRGPSSSPLPCQAFNLLIEASLYGEHIWDEYASQNDPRLVFSDHLLHGSRDVRKGVSNVLVGLCSCIMDSSYRSRVQSSFTSRHGEAKIKELLVKVWPYLRDLLPETLSAPTTAQETFDVSLEMLQTTEEVHGMADFIEDCKELLSVYEPEQIVGQENDDPVTFGLTRLLLTAVETIKRAGFKLVQPDLVNLLLKRYLLPELSDSETGLLPSPSLPILKSSIRQEMYTLVLALLDEEEDFNNAIESVSQPCPPDTWGPQIQNDRWLLRAEAGHAGLRNLSNTCYLNSLFTHLYMNLHFREFILNLDSQERLLIELKKLFAFMQSSYNRCIDPIGVVECIQTYDNVAIDITIQMDVDEFYNLLFDRLEAKMPTPELKASFRSIYGGQLVQQIKSKECEHVSERLEPFSAIQCDIRGKLDLEESLRAYVEGEVMQGDNKYSCSRCNQHVDAVKRACLKDVPDHLIFHLKRFDFDINTMTRRKINDEFAFPNSIDMAPYTLDTVAVKGGSTSPDMFELVGVLIHSGTAETGHYYSLIRERPSSSDAKNSWLQFNDADVLLFEHERLREFCFGGFDTTLNTPKVWSAYMLFYQRVSSVRNFTSKYPLKRLKQPIRLPLPMQLSRFIMLENELLVRLYCVQDPAHALFVRSLLQKMRQGSGDACSEDHEIEDKVLKAGLEYVDQVSSRFKELPEVELSFKLLSEYSGSCWRCANTVVQYLRDNPSSFPATVLRNPQNYVRTTFSSLISCSLRTLRDWAAAPSSSSSESSRRGRIYNRQVAYIVKLIDDQWDRIHLYSRGWNEYFGLLCKITTLDSVKAGVVLDHDFLERCLSLVWLDIPEDPGDIRASYPTLLRWKEKGRPFSYQAMMDLLANLLQCIDLTAPVNDEHEVYDRKYSLVKSEMNLLRDPVDENTLVLPWLNRCISKGYNWSANSRLIEILALEDEWSRCAYATIADGLEEEPSYLARPFLRATLVFCQCSPEQQLVVRLAQKALDAVETIGDYAGRENVNFIRCLSDLDNLACGFSQEHFRKVITNRVTKWAPALLMYKERAIRAEAVQLLDEYVLDHLTTDEEITEEVADFMALARAIAVAICDKFNETLKQMRVAERGSGAQFSGARVAEAFRFLESVSLLPQEEESDERLEVPETMNWMRSLIEANGSGEEEESDEWTQNASDSDDPDLLMDSGSFAALTP